MLRRFQTKAQLQRSRAGENRSDQRAAADFYYRDELEPMVADGHLTKLSTAFSRDQAEKVYVQNRMTEKGAEFFKWLEEGAAIYVCGDASRMAKDVAVTS